MPGAADEAVLARAAAEGRVLVTLDRDFGELLFRRAGAGAGAAPAGVVFFRDVPPDPAHVGAALLALAAAPEAAPLVGQFTVVGARTTGQRPLPGSDPGRHHPSNRGDRKQNRPVTWVTLGRGAEGRRGVSRGG